MQSTTSLLCHNFQMHDFTSTYFYMLLHEKEGRVFMLFQERVMGVTKTKIRNYFIQN